MEAKRSGKSRFSIFIPYGIIIWTLTCFAGTWYVIIKYRILPEGFIATVMTIFFGIAIWIIPLAGLIILSLYLTPPEESPSHVMFKDLIRKGMKRGLEQKGKLSPE